MDTVKEDHQMLDLIRSAGQSQRGRFHPGMTARFTENRDGTGSLEDTLFTIRAASAQRL